LLSTNALTAAHEVVVPIAAEFLALAGLTVLLTKLERVRALELNPELLIRGFIITMDDGRTTHSQEMKRQLQAQMAGLPILGAIKRSTQINHGLSAGEPITRFRPGSEMAAEYRAIVAKLLMYWGWAVTNVEMPATAGR
jgi:chromosome partitioning protein